MKATLTIAAATAALAAGGIAATGAGATAPPATSAAASAAATRHVEGRVVAIDRSARTFTVRDTERGKLRVAVTSSTKFERVTFSALRTGQRVDVRAKLVGGAWKATKVERGSAAAATHAVADDNGGRHGGGNDDPAGHR